MIDGKRTSITKATRKECLEEAVALKLGQKTAVAVSSGTLNEAIDHYIESRQNVLSPSTIRGYRMIQRNRFQSMMKRRLSDVRPDQWQRAVNTEARLCSAKTLTNAWRFISSVISEETGERISVRLPQVPAADRPWLTPEQIPIFLDAIHGHSIEIMCLLALSSLRRSEILALTWNDIDMKAGQIHVRGAAVYNEDYQLVQKRTNKNKTSARIVPIIPPLRDALELAERKSEYVCTLSPRSAYEHINRCCRKAGLPEVGIHGLRHSFASLAYHLGMPEKVAMQIGGWSDSKTMHDIYTHISQSEIQKYASEMMGFYNFGNGNWQQK